MEIALAWSTAGAVLLGAALRTRPRADRLVAGYHAALAAAGLGLLGWALTSGSAALITAALCAAAALMALFAPADPGGRGVTGAALGLAASAAALAHLGLTPAPVSLGPGAWIYVGAGAALVAGLGFALRAAARAPGAGGVAAVAAAFLGLAFAALATAGGQGLTAHLPLAGADGTPALWASGLHTGILATHPAPELGGVLGGAALAALGAVFWPAAPTRRLLLWAAGAAALAALGMALSRQGEAVQLDPEAAKLLLSRLGVAAPLVESPRLLATAPYSVDLRLLPLPLALIGAAGGALLGQALAGLEVAAGEAQRRVAALGARDAAVLTSVFAWLGLLLFGVVQHLHTGLWLANGALDHLLLGAAFTVSATLAGLFGLGGRVGGWADGLRAALLGLAALMLAGALAGGLVGAQGVFGL